MTPAPNGEPLPAWLASKIRRAAAVRALRQSPPILALLLLLSAVELVWWLGSVESVFVPLFWNAVFLAGGYFLAQEFFATLRVLCRPETSEEAAYLRGLGPLDEVVSRVEAEVAGPAEFADGKKALFTRNWLVVSGGGHFAVRRLDDLGWVFLKTTTTKLNWVIPIWRSHEVVFRGAAPGEAQAGCSKEEGARIIEHAARRCPWIIAGYDEELDKLWESDRAAFLAGVRERGMPGRSA